MDQIIHGDGQAVLKVCGCGKMHFTYGPITLHFDRDEFLAFACKLGRAADLLRRQAHGREPVLGTSRHGTQCH